VADIAPVAAVDIDGTLSDTRHRLHHLRTPRRDWEAFFAAAAADGVHPEGVAVVAELRARGLEIVYLTGRPERLREMTRAWLLRHGFPDVRLLMRPDGDRRAATAVKIAALRDLARDREIALLVDDDPRVLASVAALRPAVVAQVLVADWQPRRP
jgi:phosphoglycolate phosphatase-like HAD superfamily hydrolase